MAVVILGGGLVVIGKQFVKISGAVSIPELQCDRRSILSALTSVGDKEVTLAL